MASLRRYPRSLFWYACFTMPDGRRVQRSTKETLRKPAQAKADEWEKLSKENAKAKQAHRVIADIYKAAHKADLPDATVSSYLAGWLERRAGELGKATMAAYKGRATHFIEWLGGADTARPIAHLETGHFIRYRDSLAKRLSATTANQAIKVLRVIMEDASRDGMTTENPAKACGLLKASKAGTRRPFTLEELTRVLAVADDEWRSMILFGIYTGQRLGDIAGLTWASIDAAAGEVAFRTKKTGRAVRVPMAKPLAAHIDKLTRGATKAPLHERAAATGHMATLSRQFSELLAKAGITAKRSRKAEKQGRDARRESSELSFHCLRHTATSLMKNAGISPAIVQDIIGHESAEISAHYTHVDMEAKRKAIDSLPDLT